MVHAAMPIIVKIPDPYGSIQIATGELVSVWAVVNLVYRRRVAREYADDLTSAHIPQPHLTVVPSAGQRCAIRADGDRCHLMGVAI
jgi:hypothetical protein